MYCKIKQKTLNITIIPVRKTHSFKHYYQDSYTLFNYKTNIDHLLWKEACFPFRDCVKGNEVENISLND